MKVWPLYENTVKFVLTVLQVCRIYSVLLVNVKWCKVQLLMLNNSQTRNSFDYPNWMVSFVVVVILAVNWEGIVSLQQKSYNCCKSNWHLSIIPDFLSAHLCIYWSISHLNSIFIWCISVVIIPGNIASGKHQIY